MRFLKLISVVFCSLLLLLSAFGQSPNGNFTGLVLDPSSGALVGAQVVAVNDVTGLRYTTRTNDQGIYVLLSLPPGPYRLQVSRTGFKTIIKPDIVLNVQDALSINFTLPIGAVSDTVTVEGGSPLVNLQSASVSSVIDRHFIENLPLNGRSFNTLLQLTPGVVIASSSFSAPGQFSIGGQRTDANNFTLDGVSANFGVSPASGAGGSGVGTTQAFSAMGGTSSLVSVDALQEFRVETSSFAPEFGRTPGGQVILSTRSGTNSFHGGVFDYFRNTALDANDWFAKQAGISRAAEHHNDFGGFVGGPIWRNRTFFFFSYEGARLRQPSTETQQVPSQFARSIASAALKPFLNAYPLPTAIPSSPTANVATFTGSVSNPATLNAASLRIDHNLNAKFSLFGRYNWAPSRIESLKSAAQFSATSVDTQTATAGVDMFLSSHLLNTLRGNFSTQTSALSSFLRPFGGAVVPDPSLFLGSLPSVSSSYAFQINGTSLYAAGANGSNRTKQMNLVDDLTVVVRSHQVKFGEDYRAIFLDVNPAQYNIFYISPGMQSFLSSGTATLSNAAHLPAQVLTQSISLYGQDTWKATPRMTITYGLRWEFSPAPTARGKTALAAFTNVNNPSQLSLAPSGTPVWDAKKANFAPRIGLAYALTRKEDFVLRVGGGVFYDLGLGNAGQLPSSFPNSASAIYPGVALPAGSLTPYLPMISLSPPYPSVLGFSPDLHLPRSYQWNLALEKSFGKQVFSAGYVGQAGRDLLRLEGLYQPNARFSSLVFLSQDNAFSNYGSLQLQYRRPLSSHLQALLNYTWAHSLDNASNDAFAGASNTIISDTADYASSDFDVRHSFSGALHLEVPSPRMSGLFALLTRDWSLESAIVARSGFPFNGLVSLGGQLSAVNTRPDLMAGQSLWLPSATAPGGKVLNQGAFTIPSTARQGTEGRNNIPGFGLTQVDFSVGKKFLLTDRVTLQFRADAFNLLNHPNFSNPVGFLQFGPSFLQSQSMLNRGLGGLNPLFQEGGPRSLQLSLKLTI